MVLYDTSKLNQSITCTIYIKYHSLEAATSFLNHRHTHFFFFSLPWIPQLHRSNVSRFSPVRNVCKHTSLFALHGKGFHCHHSVLLSPSRHNISVKGDALITSLKVLSRSSCYIAPHKLYCGRWQSGNGCQVSAGGHPLTTSTTQPATSASEPHHLP